MKRALATSAMWCIRWQAVLQAGLTAQELRCCCNTHVDALAAALNALVQDAALRQRMGRRGREVAETEFSLDKVTAETLSVYQELLVHNQKRKLLGSTPKCPSR